VVYKARLQWHHDGAAEFVAVKTLRGIRCIHPYDNLFCQYSQFKDIGRSFCKHFCF